MFYFQMVLMIEGELLSMGVADGAMKFSEEKSKGSPTLIVLRIFLHGEIWESREGEIWLRKYLKVRSYNLTQQHFSGPIFN